MRLTDQRAAELKLRCSPFGGWLPDLMADREDAIALLRAFLDANGDEAAHKNVAARARAFLGDTDG